MSLAFQLLNNVKTNCKKAILSLTQAPMATTITISSTTSLEC